MNRAPLAVVIGATGAVGPAVVRAFLNSGFRVRALSRRTPEDHALPPGVEWQRAEVTEADSLEVCLQGASVVVHLAAVVHAAGKSAPPDEVYRRVNVNGTQNVIQRALLAGVDRVVYASSIAVYGEGGSNPASEGDEPRPVTVYGRTKLAAEHEVLRARRSDGKPLGTVLRVAAVYGPNVKGNYRRLVDLLARGRFIPIGRGCNRRTLIHEDDLARAIVLAATHPDAAGEVFNVTDGELHTVGTIVDAICAALGRKAPLLSVPEPLARALVSHAEAMSRRTGIELPVTRDQLDRYLEDAAVDGSKIMDMLGFRPGYRLADGWQQTVEELNSTGRV